MDLAKAENATMKEAKTEGLHKKVLDLISRPEFQKMTDGTRRAFDALKAADGYLAPAKKALAESLDESEIPRSGPQKKGEFDGHVLEITELPVRKWTQDYKEFLMGMLPNSDRQTKIQIEDMREYHTEKNVHFEIKVTGKQLATFKEQGGVENSFKLVGSISETNMVLFDSEGRIKKYKNATEIIEEFAKVRLHYYDLRKKYLVDKLTLERDLLSNRARFILLIIQKRLRVNNRKKVEVVKDLTRLKFQKFGDTRPPRSGFEYLLIMQIASLTKEKKEELERMAKEKAKELELVKRTSIQQMWVTDLDALEKGLTELYEKAEADKQKDKEKDGKKKRKDGGGSASAGGKKRRKGAAGGSGKAKDDEEEEEDEDEEQEDVDPLETSMNDISRWTAGRLLPLKTMAKSALPKTTTKLKVRMVPKKKSRHS